MPYDLWTDWEWNVSANACLWDLFLWTCTFCISAKFTTLKNERPILICSQKHSKYAPTKNLHPKIFCFMVCWYTTARRNWKSKNLLVFLLNNVKQYYLNCRMQNSAIHPSQEPFSGTQIYKMAVKSQKLNNWYVTMDTKPLKVNVSFKVDNHQRFVTPL